MQSTGPPYVRVAEAEIAGHMEEYREAQRIIKGPIGGKAQESVRKNPITMRVEGLTLNFPKDTSPVCTKCETQCEQEQPQKPSELGLVQKNRRGSAMPKRNTGGPGLQEAPSPH